MEYSFFKMRFAILCAQEPSRRHDSVCRELWSIFPDLRSQNRKLAYARDFPLRRHKEEGAWTGAEDVDALEYFVCHPQLNECSMGGMIVPIQCHVLVCAAR
jgi:hypothetical protein